MSSKASRYRTVIYLDSENLGRKQRWASALKQKTKANSLTWQNDACSYETSMATGSRGCIWVHVSPNLLMIFKPRHLQALFVSQIPTRGSHGACWEQAHLHSFGKHSFIVTRAHGSCSPGPCHLWDSFVSDRCLCSLPRKERSFLLVGVGQWPASDTHHLQNPQPWVEQSFYIVSALAFGISRGGFNLETNYPWYVWGWLGFLSGTFCLFLCAKNECYWCFFFPLLKTFYPFIL